MNVRRTHGFLRGLRSPDAAPDPSDEMTIHLPDETEPRPAEIRLDQTGGWDDRGLRLALKSPAVGRRIEALHALWEMGHPERAPMAASVLADPEHGVRSAALRILEENPGRVATTDIAVLVGDTDPSIRCRAVTLMGSAKQLDAVELVAGVIASERDEEVVVAALRALTLLLSTVPGALAEIEVTQALFRATGSLTAAVRSRCAPEIERLSAIVARSGALEVSGFEDEATRAGVELLSRPPAPPEEAPPTGGGLEHELMTGTLPALVSALDDPHVEVRHRAEEALRSVSRERLSRWLVDRVGAAAIDELQPLAGLACRLELGPAIEALCRRFVQLHPSAEREDISAALKGASMLDALIDEWSKRTDPQERAIAIRLGVMLDLDVLRDGLRHTLDDPSSAVRIEVLTAVLNEPELIGVDDVGARVRDPDPAVRFLAIRALARIQDDRSIAYLLDACHDPEEKIRAGSRDAILARPLASVMPLLIRGLRLQPVRRAAAELLVQIGPPALTTLLASLEEADEETARIIGRILAASGAAEKVTHLLEDRHAATRLQAVAAVASMRAPDAVLDLIGRLEDPDPEVRALAAGALGALGDDRARGPLERSLVEDPDMSVVAACESALRELGGRGDGS